jgi:hypothetical protein
MTTARSRQRRRERVPVVCADRRAPGRGAESKAQVANRQLLPRQHHYSRQQPGQTHRVVICIMPEGAIVLHPGNQAFNVIMKEYPLRYHLSDERATEYYQTDNILVPPRMTDKHYTGINKRLYTFKKHPLAPGTLDAVPYQAHDNLEIDMSQGASGRVIANPVAAGTELTKPINGQTIWQGQPWERHRRSSTP